MTEKKMQTMVEVLAALMYFDSVKPEKRKDMIMFEKLTEAEQSPFLAQVQKFLAAIGKMGMQINKCTDKKKEVEVRAVAADQLTVKIEEFVKGLKTVKPALFPCRELALRILAPQVVEKQEEVKPEASKE